MILQNTITTKTTDFTNKLTGIDKLNKELYKLNEDSIQVGITKVIGLIDQKTSEVQNLEAQIPEPQEQYDIDFYGIQKSELKDLTQTEIELRVDINAIKQRIDTLTNSEICETCKRKLDGVDFTSDIDKAKKELKT